MATAPMHERFAEADWQPDPPGMYCPRCGRTTGPHEVSSDGCGACATRKLPWARLVRLGEFDGVLRDMILEVKFTRWRRLGRDLGILLGRSVAAALEQAGLPRDRVVVVPMPTSFIRRMQRGIDHGLVIASGVAEALDAPVVRALARRHRPAQWSVPMSERRANVAGAFRSSGVLIPHDALTLVVDDVTTSRATLRAACAALDADRKSSGSKDLNQALSRWTAVLSTADPSPRGQS